MKFLDLIAWLIPGPRRIRAMQAPIVLPVSPHSPVSFDLLEDRKLFSVPSAPASLSASVVSSNTQIQLKWSDKSQNESGFEIYRGTSSGSMTKVASVGRNATSYKQTPPSKGKTYYYNVRAYNSDGDSKASSIVSAKVPATSTASSTSSTSSTVPTSPTSLKSSIYSNTQIELKWNDNSTNESGFEIYRGTTKSNMTRLNTVGKDVESYKTAPTKGKAYYYNVRAYNSKGNSGWAATISATLSSSSTSLASNANTIYIGSSRSVKTLNAADWPDKGDAPVRFILDSGSYSVSQHFIKGNLTIESANPSSPATIKLPDVWDSNGVASNPTLSVDGSLTIRNIKTTGGTDTILLGSSQSANIVAENIEMDGGAIWRGNGANTAYFRNNEVNGKPRANVYSSFGGNVGTAVIDHSGTNVPVQQGGKIVNGNPVGEAAIRIMNVDNLTLKGIKTTPWFYKSGHVWKQDVQLRPTSNVIKVIDCDFYQVDVGDMTWRIPAHPIDRVEFTDCTFDKMPNVTAGVDTIVYDNVKVGSNTINKTVTY